MSVPPPHPGGRGAAASAAPGSPWAERCVDVDSAAGHSRRGRTLPEGRLRSLRSRSGRAKEQRRSVAALESGR